MKKALMIALGLAVLLAATPAVAQSGGGFFVALENKFLQPTNLGTTFTLVDFDFDDVPDGEFRSVEFDNEYSPKIWVGQSFGDSGWAASYWSFDHDASEFVDADGLTTFWATLTHPQFTIFGFENIGTVDAFAEVEADTFDLIYWHDAVENGRLSLSWYGGLRYASFENNMRVIYDDDFDVETVNLMSSMDGIGMTGGLNTSVKIGEGWFVIGSLGYSYLMADVEASNSQPDLVFAFGDDLSIRREEERGITILDLSCAVGWWVTENFHLRLGYELSNWSNVSDRIFFTDDVNPGLVTDTTQDVSWDGFNLGIGVRF